MGIEIKKSPAGSEAAWLLARLKESLSRRGIKSWLFGGYVRDALLGRATADIDIAVAAKAAEVAQEVAAGLGGRFVLLDEANEVARVVVPLDSGPWSLDFSTSQGSIEEDMASRDFTINAMALELDRIAPGWTKAEVIDPFGGRQDLADGVIRAVRGEVFQHDPARLLRAVRLAAELSFAVESQTEALIRGDSHRITEVAAERVQDELCRLLALPKSDRSLRYLDRLGLLTTIIPEMEGTKGVEQPREHFWDVFDHSLETVAALEVLLRVGGEEQDEKGVLVYVPWSPVLAQHFDQEVSSGHSRKTLLKLAALLHDIAKPLTKVLDETGRTRFFGHSQEGAAMAGRIMEHLRFSSREIKMVQNAVLYHLRPTQMGDAELPSSRAIYRYFRDTGEEAIDTLFLSMADHLATRGPSLDLANWKQHCDTVRYMLEERYKEKSVVRPPKLIDGHDLIEVFGLSPGPEVGQLLEAVREAQAAGEITTRGEALSFVQSRLASYPDLRDSN